MGSLRGCIGPSGTADAVCKEVETRIESARACARSSLCRAAQIFAQNRRRGLGTWFGERHAVSSAAAHAMCKACMLPQEAVGLFQPQAWQMAVSRSPDLRTEQVLGAWFGERHTCSSAGSHAMCQAGTLPQEAVGLLQREAWQIAAVHS